MNVRANSISTWVKGFWASPMSPSSPSLQALNIHFASFILGLRDLMADIKILIIEDDSNLLATLEYNLQKEGYYTITAVDGVKAIETARDKKPDLIILDVMLPLMNGFEVCQVLRKEMTVPILILTAKVEETDKIVGLEIGADDYMTKPFSMRELLARIRAALRRSKMVTPETAEEKSMLKITPFY